MRLRIYLYTAVRILFGTFLVLHSTYDVLLYADFLQQIDAYLLEITVFNLEFIEILTPLAPFGEFILGLFLVLGYFAKQTFIVATLLFCFLGLFLLDAKASELALLHFSFMILTLVLWRKDHYNIKSMDYSKESCLIN